jgi:hypothetical protein
MVKFHIPAVENANVGDTVTVTLYNDNNLKPLAGDLSIDLDWNMEVLKYESSTFEQGRTTNAGLVGLHNLNILAADTTNGFPQGDNPLIVMKFKVIGPGYTPIVIKVKSIHDLEGTDILSKAVTKMGSVTATGTPLPTGTPGVTTGATTVTPTTVTTTDTTTTPVQTYTPLPTTVPATAATTGMVVTPVTAVPVPTGSATVPSNTGIFSVTSVGNVPVGAIGMVQVVVDNAWEPRFSDTYIDVTYDSTQVRYLSSTIHVSNTTAAARSDNTVRLLLGDFRNGYPQGKYAVADVYFTPLREGTSPLTVSVDHVRYWNSDFTQFTDISSTASTQNGAISTGPVDGTVPTVVPVTVTPTMTGVTGVPTDTVTTVATVTSAETTVSIPVGAVNRDTDEYTGVVTKTPTPTVTPNMTPNMTPNTTVPTATTLPPTTVTTIATPTPDPTPITTVTTPPTTVRTIITVLPTTTKSALPFGVLAIISLAGVALVLRRSRR